MEPSYSDRGVARGEFGPTAIHTKLRWVLPDSVKEIPVKANSSTNVVTAHVMKCEVAVN